MLHPVHINFVEEATSQTTDYVHKANTAKSHHLQRMSIMMHDSTETVISNAQVMVELLHTGPAHGATQTGNFTIFFIGWKLTAAFNGLPTYWSTHYSNKSDNIDFYH